MASTDDRVVHMEFDNQAFEKNVNNTISSLGKLEQALKLDGVKKSLADLSNQAKHLNIAEGVSSGIEQVSRKFLALSTIGITALSGLTTKALSSGAQIAKGFSLGPITDGLQEYTTNIGSIQTILANTDKYGTTLDQVTASLDELNTYSDKTIYNFGEMVKNIGLFTNAGIRIEDATSMIQGFSNVAAASGTSAEGAASAAYQLSQALSAGTVRLMDWKSLQNVGMGNKNMQQGLTDLGVAMGTVNAAGTNGKDIMGNFNGSLESGWLSAEVMSSYLKIMAGDMSDAEQAALGLSDAQIAAFKHQQGIAEEAATKVRTFSQLVGTVKEAVGSGWSNTFRIIIGNFTEATDTFTMINNAISGFVGKNADARSKVLNDWKMLGGRTFLISGMTAVFHKLGEAVKPLTKAFRDVFPRKTGADLVRITVGLTNFLQKIIPGEEIMKKFGRIFRGVFAILSIGWTVLKDGIKFIGTLVSMISKLVGGTGIVDLAADFGDFFYNLQQGLVKGKGIDAFFKNLTDLLVKPVKNIANLIIKIKEFFGSLDFSKAGKKTTKSLAKVSDSFSLFDRVTERFKMIGRGLQSLFDGFVDITGKIGKLAKDFFGGLIEAISNTLGQSNFNTILDVLNVGLLGAFTYFFKKFTSKGIVNLFDGGLFDKIKNTFSELQKTLKTFQAKIKADALFRIAEAIALITASVLVLSLIDSAALTKALAAMTVGFGELLGTFAAIQKIGEKTKQSAGSFTIIAAGLILLAGAIFILSIAAKILSTMDWAGVGKGLAAISGLMVGLVASVKILQGQEEDIVKAGATMIGIAIAIGLLGVAMKIFASMDTEKIAKGLATIAGTLAVMVTALKNMPDLKGKGVGLLQVGISLNLLAFAAQKFGDMQWDEIIRGLTGMGGALLGVTLAMRAMPQGVDMVAAGGGILLLSAALYVMSKAIQEMAKLKFGDMIKGIFGLGLILAGLVIAANAMETALPGAGAMILMAGGLLIIAKALEIIGGMKIGDIVKGLVAVAATMVVLGGGALLLEAAIVPMLGLGAALMAIGLGLALFGAGAYLAAKAFVVFSKAGKDGAKNIVSALESVGKALPAILLGFAEGIVELIAELGKQAPKIVDAFINILSTLLTKLTELMPKFGALISAIVDVIIMVITEKLPEIETAGLQLIVSLIQGIADNIDDVVEAALNVINSFLDALDEHVPETIRRITKTFIDIMNSVAFNLGLIAATLMGGLALQFINGFLTGMSNNIHLIKDLWNKFPGKIVSWIGDVTKSLRQKGIDLITGLLNGIKSIFDGPVGSVVTFFSHMASNIIKLIISPLKILEKVGSDIIDGLKNGISAGWDKLKSFVGDRIDDLKGMFTGPLGFLTHSPSRFMKDLGVNIVDGLAIGLSDDSAVISATNSMIDNAKKNLMGALTTISDNLGSMNEFNPVITPVLDLSAVQNDASKIAGYISANGVMVDTTGTSNAQAIAASAFAGNDPTTGATVGGSGDVVFNQTVNAPQQLSTADIYRQTRNQIAMAKEELKIPS